MKRLIVLATALAVMGAAAFGLYSWDTQYRFYRYSGWMKAHYLLNQEAFDRLSEQLSKDALIDSAGYYPPGSLQPMKMEPRQLIDPAEQPAYDKRNEDIEAQQSRYEPFLADLKFPGNIVFSRNEKDPRLTNTLGPAADFGYVMMQSWLIHADDIDALAAPCPENPLELSSGDCAQRLGGKWWMRYVWVTWSPSE